MKRSLIGGLLLCTAGMAAAQLNITNADVTYTIDFDNTVAGVNNGEFTGVDPISDATPASGQLDADAWTFIALGIGQGSSTGGENNAGIWAFEVGPGDTAFGIQPGSNVGTPGSLTLTIENNYGHALDYWEVSFDLWYFNDENGSMDINALFNGEVVDSFTTPNTGDDPASWASTTFTATFDGNFSIAQGGSVTLLISFDDNSQVPGAGINRDEVAIDNIVITIPEPSSLALLSSVLLLGLRRRRK